MRRPHLSRDDRSVGPGRRRPRRADADRRAGSRAVVSARALAAALHRSRPGVPLGGPPGLDRRRHPAVSGDPALELWVLRVAGETAGYFELRQDADGGVEIAYFGLLPAFVGRGLGKYLLTSAVERAWARGARRVWLHTSSLDHTGRRCRITSRAGSASGNRRPTTSDGARLALGAHHEGAPHRLGVHDGRLRRRLCDIRDVFRHVAVAERHQRRGAALHDAR